MARVASNGPRKSVKTAYLSLHRALTNPAPRRASPLLERPAPRWSGAPSKSSGSSANHVGSLRMGLSGDFKEPYKEDLGGVFCIL